MGITYSTEMRSQPTWSYDKVGKHHIHFCLKCFEIKNVVVASSDIETNHGMQLNK
jgi:hypothetical protein